MASCKYFESFETKKNIDNSFDQINRILSLSSIDYFRLTSIFCRFLSSPILKKYKKKLKLLILILRNGIGFVTYFLI